MSIRNKFAAPAAAVLACLLLGAHTAAADPAGPPPLPDSQLVAGAPYLGGAVPARPLPPKPESAPWVRTLHGDTDDTNTSNYPGPLGDHPVVRSVLQQSPQFLWHRDGRLTTAYLDPTAGAPTGLAAVDPATMRVLARWFPPAGQQLNVVYMYLDARDTVLVTSKQGRLYRIHRTAEPGFTVVQDVDLRPYLGRGESLLNNAYDASGNAWFTTGAIHNVDANPGTTTTVGYVDPRGGVHVRHFAEQTDEKGIAVHGDTVFMLTAPAGAADHARAVGTMYALRAGDAGPVVAWRSRYDAGSGIKPGGFARGAGTTPAVLGDHYVAVVDNADGQVHLLVYRQRDGGLVCRTPLFAPGASYTDIGAIGYEQGGDDSLVVLNGDNDPPLGLNPYSAGSAAATLANINGPFNNMNGMSPGIERVDVRGGGCPVVWQTPERVKSVPVLSTKTGLVYAYTQDPAAAADGRYVWYFEAVDFRTGRVVWKVRAGAGGVYNDMYRSAGLGPDGTLYQDVALGVVMLRDES